MQRALKPCNKAGCVKLTRDRYCEDHKIEDRQYDKHRGTAAERGYDSRWQKYRAHFLRQHPLCACEDCKHRPVPLPADVVDHIIPHKGDKTLFWDTKNHQPMNKRCHDKKTAREDGGFGR